MTRLTILYDHGCGLCCAAASWIDAEPKFLPIETLPSMSQRAAALFPSLNLSAVPNEVIVIADSGEVWRGPDAWIICLWALRKYRALSVTLSRPGWKPIAAKAVDLLCHYRLGLSRLLHLEARRIAAGQPDTVPTCPSGRCGGPALSSHPPLVHGVR